MTTTLTRRLYNTLQARPRPEEVADLIHQALLQAYPDPEIEGTISRSVPQPVRSSLNEVIAYSHRWAGSWSSMGEDFNEGRDQVRRTEHAIDILGTLIPEFEPVVDYADYSSVVFNVMEAGTSIYWSPADNDFKAHRLSREQRKANGVDISKRQYNRRFRALNRAMQKANALATEQRKRMLIQVGRSGFAHEIDYRSWQAHTGWPERAFIAYFSARKNVRRGFTLSGRDNPYDGLCASLMAWIGEQPAGRVNWKALASVHPTEAILAHVSAETLGELMAKWWKVMVLCSDLMADVWNPDAVDRNTFGVHRNMDSSTWNTMAQAFNAARSGWINVVTAAGATEVFEAALPPKAMRLMAADLMRWHTMSGGSVHPDTLVAAALPLPWEVVRGEFTCTMNDVIVACEKAGVDADATGWTAPRAHAGIATFKPTPELVHGVAIADPGWAQILRKAGVFSGSFDRLRPDLIPGGVPADVIVSDLPDFRHEQ